MTDTDTFDTEKHPEWETATEFDESSYDSSIGNRIKQGWIVFQCTMMTIFMIRGLWFYRKPHIIGADGAFKTKCLLCFQSIIIFYLAINEFTHRHISGLFIILLFTQYSLFITFCIVMDSMATDSDRENLMQDRQRCVNYVFRWCMHLITLALFISTFFMKDCHQQIYPINFVALVSIIFIHQGYDIYLMTVNYMIKDDAALPEMKRNKLKFNKELFQKQTKFLFWGNIVFGLLAVLTVAAGYFIINRQHQPGANQHLLCLHGYEWIYMSPVGNVFGTLHQVLVLMQINITQFVLVRMPDGMGVFTAPSASEDMAHGMRAKLLSSASAVNDDGEKNDDGEAAKPKSSLAILLSKLKENQAKDTDDHHMRA